MTQEASGIEEWGWMFEYGPDGEIIAVPIEPPHLPRGYVEPPEGLKRHDSRMDPESVRAARAKLGSW